MEKFNLFIVNKPDSDQFFGESSGKLHRKAFSILFAYIQKNNSIPLIFDVVWNDKIVKYHFMTKHKNKLKYYCEFNNECMLYDLTQGFFLFSEF